MDLNLLDAQLEASVHGDLDEAWRLALKLEKERPHDNRAAFNRGWHYLRRGEFQKGMELIERGRLESVYGAPAPKTQKPRWNGSAELKGKNVLLRGEGGFGDELVGLRFARTLASRGALVTASVSDGIVSLASRVPGVASAVPHRVELESAFDFWVPAMSAPLDLGLTYESLPSDPYLSPLPKMLEKWASIITAKELRVGIRWSGNPKFEHEQQRRFPPELLFNLRDIPNVQLYSLQRDHDLRDLPEGVIDLQHKIETWEDTAAAIENLDLVITSCTSIAHLAGALGKETWIVIPILPYYLWALPGATSPWYRNVRLFRQEVFGDWEAPFKAIRERLQAKAHMHTPHVSALPLAEAEPEVTPGGLKQFATLAGMKLRPAPSLKRSAHPATAKSTLHFVAGLPRSGSTALLSLLGQNPRIYTAPISGLASMFSGLQVNWDKTEFHLELPNPEAKKRVLRAILENYHATERPVILDKDRHWMTCFEVLEEVLERSIKMILPVRPVPEILASFEALRRKHPMEFSGADENLGAGSTIATRAQYYASPNGVLGLAYNAMKDAVTMGYFDRVLFVDYNKLMSAPRQQLGRIYQFLGEPYFEHDLSHVAQTTSNWHPHKLPHLHDVRPEFKKEEKRAREILGDVYGTYDQIEPWISWT